MQWYSAHYEELTLLNPDFPIMIRTGDNCMPAVTTELEFQTNDLLRFMIQTKRFRNADGTIATHRVKAAQKYLTYDFHELDTKRVALKGFDPEKPFLDRDRPGWRDDPLIKNKLGPYFDMRRDIDETMKIIKSGHDKEYVRGENALLMCQRVDLWCAGPKEVERAVIHLYKLAKHLNAREVDMPFFITDYYPGADEFYT